MMPARAKTSPLSATVEPAIAVDKLGVRYGDQTALHDVTLRIAPRSITAVIGPSGCGKTSLLMCLNRMTDLLPLCAVTGRVRIGDLEVFDRRTDVVALRRRVGLIFQQPHPFPLSVYRNLELPLREQGLRRSDELQQRIEGALRDVGLWDEIKDRLHRPAVSLSGGQQQRLCLARALVLCPEVLLLDEPCSALDPISVGAIEELLKRLAEQYTVLVVTHNLAQARRIADHVALLWRGGQGGTLIEHGPADQVFGAPREALTAAYVDGRVG